MLKINKGSGVFIVNFEHILHLFLVLLLLTLNRWMFAGGRLCIFLSRLFFQKRSEIGTHLSNTIPAGTPAGIPLLKTNHKNTRARYEIWTKLSIKTPE